MSTHVVALGTGTPIPDPDASGPAFAVVTGGHSYLIDCGPGIVRRAALAANQGFPELSAPKLDRLFLTHLHSDHTAGLPDLLLTPWVVGRRHALQVHGPRGTRQMLEKITEAYVEDIAIRTEGLEANDPQGVAWRCREIRAGKIFSDDQVKVKAFRVQHGSWKHCFGFRFETADRTIVFSGDTAMFRELPKRIGSCDVLVHEVCSELGLSHRPVERQHYHRRFHTSTVELAQMAAKLRPGLLVLTHQLGFGVSNARLVEEIRELYDGPVVSARDLGVY